MSASLKVASFHVRATVAQSARWKQCAEAEGFPSVGAWAACALDAYLKARARAGAPVPLAWRRGAFKAVLDGEERTVRGFVSTPFGAFRGLGDGRLGRYKHLHRLVFLPDGRTLATVARLRDCKALAADLARLWVRAEELPGLTLDLRR